MTHTPGPWELDEDYGVSIVGLPGYEGDPNNRRIVLSICEPDEMDYWDNMDEEDRANIALMIAAPELLEACDAINEWCGTDDGAHALPYEPPWAEKLRAAIRKAKGEL